MRINRSAVDEAAAKELITQEQAEDLWAFFLEQGKDRPKEMNKTLITIITVFALFPVITGFSIRNKATKIGIGFIALGFLGISLARYLYPDFAYPIFGETAEKNMIIRGYLLKIWELGLWLATFGGIVVYIKSTFSVK